jgi:hypothetical protein
MEQQRNHWSSTAGHHMVSPAGGSSPAKQRPSSPHFCGIRWGTCFERADAGVRAPFLDAPRARRRLLSLLFVLALILARLGARAAEPSDPILELLLQKGVVSEEEVRKAREQAAAIRSNSLANAMAPTESKWKVNNAIKSLELYGDARLRFENREATDPNDGRISLRRFRYSLRFGLRGDILDDFYFGVRLDTGVNPRSPWVTMGTSASGTPYQGPFGKSNAGINAGHVYLGWRGLDWLDITAGKMPNPIYTTPMVWDSDLAPEGMAERVKHQVGPAEFFVTFGQFLYQDTNPNETPPGYFNLGYNNSNPLFLLAWQAGVKYDITRKFSAKVAPVLYTYTGHGANTTPPGANAAPDFAGTFVGQGTTNGVAGANAFSSGYPGGGFDGFAANQTGINNLLVLEIPWEFNYKLDTLNLRLFGDYAQNLEGSERAQAAFTAQQSPLLADVGLIPIPSPQTHDNKAYQVGFAVGNRDSLGMVNGTTGRKHGWEFRTYWQHIEQYALDVNLIDSDFFEGRANLEGIYAAFAYGFTDNVIATLRYGYARRINDQLGTGGSNQDIPQMNPIEHYSIVQFDLGVRF